MNGSTKRLLRIAARCTAAGFFAASTFLFAQNLPAPSPAANQQASGATGGWKRVGDAPQDQPSFGTNSNVAGNSYQNSANPGDPNQAPPPPPPVSNQPGYNQPAYGQAQPPYGQPNYGPPNYGPPPNYPAGTNQAGPQNQPNYQPPPVPSQLTLQPGTFLTVRVNQLLSSDKSQVGDAFSASLVQPVVVNGVVVAEPGQTIGGRVTEAEKAGHVEGIARLGIQLTELTLVDGQQVPIRTQFISRSGPSSVGQDAGTIAGTTALGAAIGAAAGWGKGAAIGAGAGAAAGIIGVLVTRGHPSIVTPEQVLTFRIDAPVTISTANASQAFRYVQPNEYDRPVYNQPPPGAYGGYAGAAPAPYPPYYGYPYPYYASGYPYYWGPSFTFFYGPGYWWGGRWYGGHRYYGRAVIGGVHHR